MQTAKADSVSQRWRAPVCALVLGLSAAGCARRLPAPHPPPPDAERAGGSGGALQATAGAGQSGPGAEAPPVASPEKLAQSPGAAAPVAAQSLGPQLPPGVEVGRFHTLPTQHGDVEVLHASAEVRRALIYLHGACGDIHAANAFADVVTRYATLIALRGERSCGRVGRYYWNGRAAALMLRVEQALQAVSEARAGLLDTREVVLFGYSQGSQVAQLLAERWPERFPEVILGGVPSTPSVPALRNARSVAIIGGSNELLTPMRGGVWLLEHNQVRTQLFVLDGAPHGSFGDTPNQDLQRVFAWLFD